MIPEKRNPAGVDGASDVLLPGGNRSEGTLDTERQQGRYPYQPGYKDDGPGRQAAIALMPKLGKRRAEALEVLRTVRDATPDEIATRICRPPHTTRPRLSELYLLGLAVKTGARRPSAFGTPQTVYRIATAEELALFLARKAANTERGEGGDQ